jgi:hypothetical protein
VSDESVRAEIVASAKGVDHGDGTSLRPRPQDLERYRKDGFEITSSAMVDRVTAVINKIEGEPNDEV